MARRKANKANYKAKMRFIKPFVSFDFKAPERLGRRNKAKITKYYKFLKETEKGFFPVKSKKFKTAQKQLNPEFRKIKGKIAETEFKVIFVPKNNPSGTRVEFDGKKAYFKSEFMRQEFIPFEDKERLIFETRDYVTELVKDLPITARVGIQTQTATIVGTYEPLLIIDEVVSLVESYDDIDKWIVGLDVTYLENLL